MSRLLVVPSLRVAGSPYIRISDAGAMTDVGGQERIGPKSCMKTSGQPFLRKPKSIDEVLKVWYHNRHNAEEHESWKNR